jgi:hypothetical protein
VSTDTSSGLGFTKSTSTPADEGERERRGPGPGLLEVRLGIALRVLREREVLYAARPNLIFVLEI